MATSTADTKLGDSTPYNPLQWSKQLATHAHAAPTQELHGSAAATPGAGHAAVRNMQHAGLPFMQQTMGVNTYAPPFPATAGVGSAASHRLVVPSAAPTPTVFYQQQQVLHQGSVPALFQQYVVPPPNGQHPQQFPIQYLPNSAIHAPLQPGHKPGPPGFSPPTQLPYQYNNPTSFNPVPHQQQQPLLQQQQQHPVVASSLPSLTQAVAGIMGNQPTYTAMPASIGAGTVSSLVTIPSASTSMPAFLTQSAPTATGPTSTPIITNPPGFGAPPAAAGAVAAPAGAGQATASSKLPPASAFPSVINSSVSPPLQPATPTQQAVAAANTAAPAAVAAPSGAAAAAGASSSQAAADALLQRLHATSSARHSQKQQVLLTVPAEPSGSRNSSDGSNSGTIGRSSSSGAGASSSGAPGPNLSGNAKLRLTNNNKKKAVAAAAGAVDSSSGRHSMDSSFSTPRASSSSGWAGRRSSGGGGPAAGLAEDGALLREGSEGAADLLAAVRGMQDDKATVAAWKGLAPPLPATAKAGHLEFDSKAGLKWLEMVSAGSEWGCTGHKRKMQQYFVIAAAMSSRSFGCEICFGMCVTSSYAAWLGTRIFVSLPDDNW